MTPLPGKVLVLDDDDDVCRSLERLFSSCGFPVETFMRPAGLLAEFPLQGPSCLVLDLRLGATSGFKVLDSLGATPPICPVICITAYADIETVVTALRHRVDDFFSKPYDPEALVQSVRTALGKAVADWEARMRHAELARRMGTLRKREREVIRYAASGMLNKQIAAHMAITEITVKIHRGRAMRALGIRTAAELVRYAAFLDIDLEMSPVVAETRRRGRKGDR